MRAVSRLPWIAALMLAPFATPAHAALVDVTITARNLAAANSISFAPLRFGFNSGAFDAFNRGQTANAAITSIAEGGSGSAWLPAFAAADPGAVIGTAGGVLTPGSTGSVTVRVDTAVNPFFTFAAMAVPSNDFFIGNDNPAQFRIFDAAGALLVPSILQQARDIWDAGSEAFDPAAAAFLVNGNNDLRTPQNGVVDFNFTELARFDGLTTAAGYVLNSNLQANTDVFRISFSATPVPEPATLALAAVGLLGLGLARRRHR